MIQNIKLLKLKKTMEMTMTILFNNFSAALCTEGEAIHPYYKIHGYKIVNLTP